MSIMNDVTHYDGMSNSLDSLQCIKKNQSDLLGYEFDLEPTSVLDLTSCISPPLHNDVWAHEQTTMDYEQQQRQIMWEQQQQVFFWQQQNQQLWEQQLWEQQQLCLWEQQQAELQLSPMVHTAATDQYTCGIEDILHNIYAETSERSLMDFHLGPGLGSQLQGFTPLDHPLVLEDWISGSGHASLASASDDSSISSVVADDLDTAVSADQEQQAVINNNVVQNSFEQRGSTNCSPTVELLDICVDHDFAKSNFSSSMCFDCQFSIEDIKSSSSWFVPIQQSNAVPAARPIDIAPDSPYQLLNPIPSTTEELTDRQQERSSYFEEIQLRQPPAPVGKASTSPSPILPKRVDTLLSSSLVTDGTKPNKQLVPSQPSSHILRNNYIAEVPISRKRSSPDFMADKTSVGVILEKQGNDQGTSSGEVVTLAELARESVKVGGVQLPTLGTQIPSAVRLALETQASGLGAVRMVQVLLACAEAVACRDSRQANILLQQLQHMVSPYGDAMQRITGCFVGGLTARLAMTGCEPFMTTNVSHKPPTEADKLEGFNLVYQSTPYVAFGHFAANSAILEAFEGEETMHVIDLGMSHALQWPYLIHSLARRPGGPPRLLRITGFGMATERMKTAGEELVRIASDLQVPFEFRAVTGSLEGLKRSMLQLREGEVLAVNSVLQLHSVVKESRGSLNAVLQRIHELSPKILALVEQDASHNGPFFLGRFMEALHYYSAIFDSLDAILPRNSKERVMMEQFHFAEEIKNIVSCEGPARVERHERIDQWRRRMSRAGFLPLPLKFMIQTRMWLGLDSREGYTLTEEKGCLVLGWKGKPIIAASSWSR